PAMIGGLGHADLAAEVGDGHAFGQVAVGVFQQSSDFVVGPSLAHGSLPVQVYRGTPISSGPISGGQPRRGSPDTHLPSRQFASAPASRPPVSGSPRGSSWTPPAGSATFSGTVRLVSRLKCWKIIPIRCRASCN